MGYCNICNCGGETHKELAEKLVHILMKKEGVDDFSYAKELVDGIDKYAEYIFRYNKFGLLKYLAISAAREYPAWRKYGRVQ